MYKLISKWAPVDEKGKFLATITGSSFGTIGTWPLAGFLIETIGWAYSFYVTAIMVGVFTIFWFCIVYDEPAVHPRINSTEKEYIESHLFGIAKSTKKV